MKKKPLNLKSKMGVCVLLFAFLLLPVSTNITLAADEVIPGDKDGAKVAEAETGAGAGEAAAGVAATGASTGLSGVAIAAIAVGVAAAAIAVVAASSGGDDTVTPTAHH